MDFIIEKAAQDVINNVTQKINTLKTLNIIVAGKTGVGKSTLINAVFKEKLAETGVGKPVTDHMRKLFKKGIPLAIYDTRGFELGGSVQKKVRKEINDTIRNGVAAKDINKAIHCIWYCISTSTNRVEPEEIEWLKTLSNDNQITQVPIIIILTQSFNKKNAKKLRALLFEENIDVVQIIPVVAEDLEFDDDYTVKSYGLDTLLKVMAEALPEELLETLQNVQIASLEEKKRLAQSAVATAAVAAAGIGGVPIPFSDCALLIPTQIGMLASITVTFGFDVDESIIMALLSSTIGSGGAALLGKAVVSNILKFIPGIGTIGGSAISAGTAGIITAALGEAYIGVMELVFEGEMKISDLSAKTGKKTMEKLFKQQLALPRK